MPKGTKSRAVWGSLSYDPKRKVGRIRYWAETKDGYRRCSKTVRGTRKECEEARAALMLDHSSDAPCPTVSQAWERWVLPTYEQRLAEGEMAKNTLKVYKSVYQHHVKPRWGKVPCDQVRALAVQQWISDGKTYEQANKSCVMLSAILDFALRYEAVPSNVMRAKYVMPPKSSTKVQDKGVWNLKQIGELWQHVHGSFIEPAFILSAFGSCRVGESMAPLTSDVSERTVNGVRLAVVKIDKQVENKGKTIVHATKTKSSIRHVVIAGSAADVLLSVADSVGNGLLTNDGMGGVVTQFRLNSQWKRLVPPDMFHPFRNLRNSWQTYMRWELGVPPYLIEPMMGHIGEGVTGQYYDRPQVDVFCETVARAYADHPYDAGWTWLD